MDAEFLHITRCCIELSTFMGQVHGAGCPKLSLVIRHEICHCAG